MIAARMIAASIVLSVVGSGIFSTNFACIFQQPARVSALSLEDKRDGLLAKAVASSSFEMWSAQFPRAAEAGEMFGQEVSASSLVPRVFLLKQVLKVGWAQVLGLVSADSMVLFVGHQQMRQAFQKLSAELGGHKAALDVLQKEPMLLSNTADIAGKGGLIRSMSSIAETMRPFERSFLQADAWSEYAPPTPLGLVMIGLSSQ